MDPEATAVVTTSEVAPTVMPDSPMPKVEAPEVQAPVAEQTDIDLYLQAIASDAENKGYNMSEAESDAFLSVQDKIHSGEIEDPALSRKAEEPSKPKEEPNPEVKAEPETPSETDSIDASEMTMAQADYLQKAMTQVGAKDLSELPGKVEGLIKQMKSSGGKLGGERDGLQVQLDQHTNFMIGLRNKDPEALAHLKQLTGVTPNSQAVPQEAYNAQDDIPAGEMLDSEEYLDNKLAPIVKALMGKVDTLVTQNEALTANDTKRAELSQGERDRAGHIDTVVGFIGDHPDDFGLTTSEARALSEKYWSREGATTSIHPKFQKVHDLIEFANTEGMPSLESAFIILQHKNGSNAQKLIDATKQGAKQASHIESPNGAISEQQGRTKSDIPDPTISDDMVSAMEKGDLNAIPDSIIESWTDEAGNFERSKVPQRFHVQCFGS
jgi:hypothetical protein